MASTLTWTEYELTSGRFSAVVWTLPASYQLRETGRVRPKIINSARNAAVDFFRRMAMNVWPSTVYRTVQAETKIFFRFAKSRRTIGSKYRGQLNLKVVIGCGYEPFAGYVNLDLIRAPGIDYWDCRRSLPFDDSSVALIFAEHVFEHFEYQTESASFLRECRRCLMPGGVLRIIVPDAGLYLSAFNAGWETLAPVRQLIKTDGGYRDPWLNQTYATRMELINAVFRQFSEHKYAYDAETLQSHLQAFGFDRVIHQSYKVSMNPEAALDKFERRTESLYVEAIN